MKKLLFIALFGGFAIVNANAQERTDSNRQDHSYNKDKVDQNQTYDKDNNKADHNRSYDKNKVEISKSDVPEAVISAFETKFANATDVEWKNKDGNYKVKFDMNGEDHMAVMDRTGRVISKGMEIDEQELPAAVNNAVSSKYKDEKIDDAYKMEKDGKTMYVVKLEGNEKKKLIFDEQGNMVEEK